MFYTLKKKSFGLKKERQQQVLVESETTIQLVGMSNGAATLEKSGSSSKF